LYDNEFFNKIEDKASNDWAGISILAHEIGHHLNGHSLNNDGSTHQYELEADEFSGFVLARMGSTLEDAQSAINTLKYEKATRTHPAKADRLVSIERGWKRGKGKTIEFPKVVIPKDVFVIEEEIVEDDEPKEIVSINEEEIPKGKLIAEQVILNYINAIGGQEKIKKIKTLILNFEIKSKTKYNNKNLDKKSKRNSKSRINKIHLTPSKHKSRIKSNSSPIDIVVIDDKQYLKMDSGKWKMSSNPLKDHYSFGSYIPEYSLLIRNVDISFLGVEKIKGKFYNVIQLPESDIYSSKETTNVISQKNYYSVDTGLLYMSKTSAIMKTVGKQPLKDSEATFVDEVFYTDYKQVNGVLFSFRLQSISLYSTDNTEAYSESNIVYSKILINENVDKEIFNISIE
ncbi:MAG: hypothetical protein ACI87N_001909, partial [Flavobacteriales bacterium]